MEMDRRALLGAAALSSAVIFSRGILAAELVVLDRLRPLLRNQRVILDTHLGNDDGIAITMALSAPNLTVEAITLEPGNVECDQAVQRALYIVKINGLADAVSVHRGMSCPLNGGSLVTKCKSHGDALDEQELPMVDQQPSPENAVHAMIRIIREHPKEVVILALGNLCNVAMALLRDPEIARLVQRIHCVMDAEDNALGYNAFTDFESVHIVLASGAPLTFGVGRPTDAFLTATDLDTISGLRTSRASFFIASNNKRLAKGKKTKKLPGSANRAAMAAAMLIDPSVVLTQKAIYARVEREGACALGFVLCTDEADKTSATPGSSVALYASASNEKFKAILLQTLAKS